MNAGSCARLRKKMKKILCIAAVLIVAGLAGIERESSSQTHGAAELPDAPGAGIARHSCLVCHEADIIAQQRLSKSGWTREVDKMMRWGADVEAHDKALLVDYLASHFSAGSAAPRGKELVDDAGVEIVKSSCVTCHEADLIIQQRLSKAGWTREVDKMIRWGADVKPEDKQKMIEYLAKHYPPDRP